MIWQAFLQISLMLLILIAVSPILGRYCILRSRLQPITNQQHYSGETTFSYASQVLALGYLMFTSAATGIAVAIAFIRGLTGQPLGNFYLDLTRSITRILLPISIVGAIATTGTMCGAVNGMHDSLMPTGGFTTLFKQKRLKLPVGCKNEYPDLIPI